MADREKVIKGLECCAIGLYCPDEECPYEKDKEEKQENCIALLARDALEVLKAQEPRVMTLNEVKALPAESDVWVEITGAKWSKPRITATTIHGNGGKEIFGWLHTFNFAAYGKEIYGWICWTARPTEEQRNAVKWDE